MNLLDSLIEQSLIDALGWALIHFIWQGTLIAILLAAVLRMFRAWSSNLRYAAACVAMFLMLVLPTATMALIRLSATQQTTSGLPYILASLKEQQSLPDEYAAAIAPLNSELIVPPAKTWYFIRSESLIPLLPWMILFWFVGVIFFSLRLTCGWLYTQRLKSHLARELGDKWEETLRRLCEQLQVMRPIRLFESALVGVPTAIGWLRPVILLPASALTGLSFQQLEAILAHELAHVRRHDYLVNLLQAVIETLLFYHPAVWWVSRRVRQEREHCCDDLAVAVCGNALTYARALLEMEQLRAAGPQLAMAANGGLFMNRIQRLLGMPTQQTNRFPGLVAGLMLLLATVGVGFGAQSVLPASTRDKFEQPEHTETIQRDGKKLKDEQLKRVAEQLEQVEKLKDEQLKRFEEQLKQEEHLKNEQLMRVAEQVKQVEKMKEEQLKRVVEQQKQEEQQKNEQLKRDLKPVRIKRLRRDVKLKDEQLKRDEKPILKKRLKRAVKLKDEQLKYDLKPVRIKRLRRDVKLRDEQLKRDVKPM